MGKGAKPATQVTTSEPWAPSQTALKGIIGDAQGLYDSGVGPTPFGSKLADQSSATTDALAQSEADARGGLSPMLSSGLDWAKSQFGQTGVNPYVEDAIRASGTDAANSVAARMSASGRYGSGAMGGAIADRVANIGAQTRVGAFENQQNRNLALAGQLPTLEALRQSPTQRLAEVGTMRDLRSQDVINDQVGQQEEKWSAPWQRLGLLQGTVQPIAGLGGTQTGVSTPAQAPMWQQVLGGGMALAGGLGKLGGAGGLASLFALSDARAKTDISDPIAHTEDGIPVRSYRYKDGGPVHIGFLAQEVAQKRPHAVGVRRDGLMAVNYTAATEAA